MKGNRCFTCHSTAGLDIHHTAEDGLNTKRQRSRRKEYLRLIDHPEDFALLCKPCHNRVTMNYVRSFRAFRRLFPKT